MRYACRLGRGTLFPEPVGVTASRYSVGHETQIGSSEVTRRRSNVSMHVTQEHVIAGCNRVVGALDWGDNHLVAYAAHNLVILYDPQVRVA